jgi:integrase
MLPFAFCAISSGARAGELLSLEWKDVDLAKGVATIHTSKSGEGGSSTSAAKPRTAQGLQQGPQHQIAGRVPAELGRAAHPLGLRQAVPRGAGEGRHQGFRFHDLRHTAASYLAQNGATLLEIQQILGHKTPTMTARYAHLVESHVESVVDRVMNEGRPRPLHSREAAAALTLHTYVCAHFDRRPGSSPGRFSLHTYVFGLPLALA